MYQLILKTLATVLAIPISEDGILTKTDIIPILLGLPYGLDSKESSPGNVGNLDKGMGTFLQYSCLEKYMDRGARLPQRVGHD